MPLDTQSRIDKLLQRLERGGLVTPTSELYAEGIKTKLRQAQFALEGLRRLQYLEDQPDVHDATTIPTAQGLLNVSAQVSFYCDCFWDFLRSALDILGQLVNELRSLGISERNVDIKKVANEIKSTALSSTLDKALDGLLNSSAFKQLEDYRHCSTHRRPIYIQTRTVTTAVTGTPGYYSGSSEQRTTVERYLCTNPWDLTPRVYGGRRPVVKYCESLLQRIKQKIDGIVNRLP